MNEKLFECKNVEEIKEMFTVDKVNVEEKVDKDLEIYATAIKGITDPKEALKVLMKIKKVPASTSQKFQDNYGKNSDGSIIWDYEKVVKNFIDDIN